MLLLTDSAMVAAAGLVVYQLFSGLPLARAQLLVGRRPSVSADVVEQTYLPSWSDQNQRFEIFGPPDSFYSRNRFLGDQRLKIFV